MVPVLNHLLIFSYRSLRQTFNEMDLNGDGKLTFSELERALEKQGFAGIKDEIKNLIRGLEIDANNTIEYSEVRNGPSSLSKYNVCSSLPLRWI